MANGLDETARAGARGAGAQRGRDPRRAPARRHRDATSGPTARSISPTTASPPLDLVVASVHSAFNQDRQQMTDRLLRAIDNPNVDIIGHPTGRRILKREPYLLDIEAIADAAARRACRFGDQLPGGSARSERCPCETGPRPRRPHRHLE